MNTHTYILFLRTLLKGLNRLNLEIHEVGHQKCIAIETSPLIERIISRKCNTHVKYAI
jgi:hypothetical protein